MRSVSSVRVEKVAFHELHRRPSGEVDLRLSEVSLVLDRVDDDGEPSAERYLTEHVMRSLNDPIALAASFESPELPTPHALERLFEDDDFLAASQDVARQLFEVLKHDARISAGTVAVVQYLPDGGDRCVGVIKFDPSTGFTLVERLVGEKTQLVLDTVDGVLPSVRERLQKCAFVRRRAAGQPFQLLVLDRQTRSEEVADWFLHRFLSAEEVATDQTRTQEFYRAAVKARQAVEADLTESQRRGLDAARDQALRDNHISVDTFIENRAELPTDDVRERYRAAFEGSVTDHDFDVDRPTAERLLKKAKFVGDGGLVLIVDLDDIERVGELEHDPVDDRPFVRIWTESWDRK